MFNLIKLSIISSLLAIISCYPGEIIYTCYTDTPKVHLSFDDAITFPQTDNILDVLKEYNISAAFYVLTSLITPENYNDTKRVINRMKNEDHVIGNHGHNHYNLMPLNETQMKYEIDTSTELMTDLLGYKPLLFRPPYGSVDNNVKNYLQSHGYTIVLWNVGNVDWYYNNSTLSNQAMCTMVPSTGGIFVMHNDYQGANNGDGLKQLIQILNKDYADVNFSAPFEVPNDPYFPYASFLQCINRENVNDIPSYYIVNNDDDSNDEVVIIILVCALIVGVIVAFGIGYYVHGKCKTDKRDHESTPLRSF